MTEPAADPRDDFSIFADSVHMFFNVSEPFVMLRAELEDMFRQQIASTKVLAITCEGEPKFLTLGRRLEHEEGEKVVVTHYGVCFQCSVDVETDEHREEGLRCTMTLAIGELDRPGEERMQAWMDVHEDADAAFSEEVFRDKFLGFRGALE
ncbi:hypothetical protein G6O69_09200 [Pseudenhygromyxa sp. WMMC2535]|uniref:hypothetical protein n=1 Tax=Pseudenhygromyxa sp. WMMC2535 TaxID=2712867 RepID=UPI001551FA64|nr:hypothetical protein [Pseudenhygromyxa sp. WMMC2535]NVB38007.1 hypothetical protein [Pseudenhygromyxa sp. WMMC2535]